MKDIERLLILNAAEGIGNIRLNVLIKRFGSLDKIFKAKEDELATIKGIGTVVAKCIRQAIKDLDVSKELELAKKHGVEIISILDKTYPNNLKNIHSPPIVLYVKGKILPEDDLSVAVVGSRIASYYGLEQAEKLSYEMALRGITIVSGLARGIDSMAHKGALKAKGRTLAILGSGIANIYPEENIPLADKISINGAVISEFHMTMSPEKENFPRRNRIISGLSLGVVIVEAGEKSGALITGDMAMEQGRDVFCVPGKVDSATSKGTNSLIKQGAKLVTSVDDIIEELNIPDSKKDSQVDLKLPKLDKRETLVYNLISSEPVYIDDIYTSSGMDTKELSKILLNLEVKKVIKQLPGKNFVKIHKE